MKGLISSIVPFRVKWVVGRLVDLRSLAFLSEVE